MPELVTNGALLSCNQGLAPSALVVEQPQTTCSGMPVATIMEFVPETNILTFGMCKSPANPVVAAATAAAMGTPTPAACIPNIVAPWTPGSRSVLIGEKPALTKNSQCMCLWGGSIKIDFPGQATTQVGS